MSGTTPNNLITQVSRESGQSSLIQTQPAPQRKKGLLDYICCCFRKGETERGDEYRKDLSLEPIATDGALLPAPIPSMKGKKCLVLDLDETLVHSSFKPIPNPDFIVPVEIEEQIHKVYVLKRPGVDNFLRDVGVHFEVVVFTASLSKYADPVLDLLDIHKVVKYRLFREACSNYKGNYVKDLNRIGRDLKHSIIIDNSPTSYLFHPENAIPVETWFDDENDTELDELVPFLRDIANVDDVRTTLEARKKNGKLMLK
eukprot:TRINITY_DN3216_c0_g1_i1.p1 TRINITY_DN3216_c0_g1~~TRINITY_DN3216_c0_g1_i1.p1  ORF type:complete len:257 (-),score=64.59 TRINITY_DN3216_c0_g1_i1:375-1145(-)